MAEMCKDKLLYSPLELVTLGLFYLKLKVNVSLYQAVEAHRVVRRRGSHIF
jgi:hypothetical protein